MLLVVCSLERKYDISVNTGNNTLCLMKDDDDDDDDDDDSHGVCSFNSPIYRVGQITRLFSKVCYVIWSFCQNIQHVNQ